MGNDRGEMVVIEPGREYKQLRVNELPEGSGASPVFAGSHLYLRGGTTLSCIGPWLGESGIRPPSGFRILDSGFCIND